MKPTVRQCLTALVEADAPSLDAWLHEDIVFVQGDGTRWQGRAAVQELFAKSEEGVSYAVVAWRYDALTVALRVKGVDGELRFDLRGRCEDHKLVWVTVETG